MGLKKQLRLMRRERMDIDLEEEGGFTKFFEIGRKEMKLRKGRD